MAAGKLSRNHRKAQSIKRQSTLMSISEYTNFPAKGHSKAKRRKPPLYGCNCPNTQQETVRILSTPICIVFFIIAGIGKSFKP